MVLLACLLWQNLLERTGEPDSKIIKVVDRDDKSDVEVEELKEKNIKVLKKRHIESYLLDDELIKKLCEKEKASIRQYQNIADVKQREIQNSIDRGNPTDDLKSAAGPIYVEIKKILNLRQCGNNLEAFLRDTMAPLITKDTNVYKELKASLFE